MLIRGEEGVRWFPISLAAIAVLAAGYFVVRQVWLDDTATQVTVDEVLDRFRDDEVAVPPITVAPTTVAAPVTTTATVSAATTTTTTAPPVVALPAPGVYVYATTGREHVDALGGTEHAYPAETTLTVTPNECGVHLRWDLLVERFEEWDLCLADGVIEFGVDSVQFHEFFGQSQTDAANCQHSVVLSPAPPPGTVTARDCLLAGEPWSPVWTHQGDLVFTASIELEHPDYWEHSTQTWTLAESGLPLRIEFDMSSRNPSPVGGVVYTETIDATLVSLTPLN